MSRNNLLAALAVLVVIIAVLVAFWLLSRGPEAPEVAEPAGRSATDAQETETPAAEPQAPAPADGAAPERATTPEAAEDGEDGEPAGEAAQPAQAATPSFDIVRVEPDGSAVIAGRAAPGAEVQIRDGETIIGTVMADERGEWVFVPGTPLAAGDRELSIVAELPDGRELSSDDVVVLSVPGPEPVPDAAGAEQAAAQPREPVAVLTPKSGGPSRVLQGPVEIEPIAEAKGLNLWAVDYVEATDELTMSGIAEPGARVFLYLDNEFLGEANAGPNGDWWLSVIREIAEGEYPMRVDLVGPEGKVKARLEVPFIYLPQGFLAVGNRVTVRPGNSLWRIARRVYGEGVQYTTIYDANKAQIIDPDVIYPGQVFYVPGDR